ncbi:hypothetical protein [Streptomyces sp. NPDC127039]|uniref:hypothetical protein n=1 Tax=Streptomyces sp. NPDC127039 TaxID=3347115 RepID=UPI00364A85ED
MLLGPPTSYQVVGDPRQMWPCERDLHHWPAGNLHRLASCLGVSCLALVGREVVLGERWTHTGQRGHEQLVGGLRLDLAARDECGRMVAVEAQLGPPDHTHLGQLLTYAHALSADVAVWVVADIDPRFHAEHLTAPAQLDEVFAGRRLFTAVTVTLESAVCPAPPCGDTLRSFPGFAASVPGARA